MKPAFVFTLFASLFSALFFNASFAQEANEIVAVPKHLALESIASFKKATNNPVTEESINITNLKPVKDVPSKVSRIFYRTFENTGDPLWYDFDNKGKTFLAKFYINGRESRALYGKGGSLYYAVSDATEKDMPADYRRLIMVNYLDHTITFLAEVTTSDYQTAWIAVLQNGENQVITRIADGSLEELENKKIQNSYTGKKQKSTK